MKTKLRFLFVLLTMLWWGANYTLAAEYTVMFDNGATQSTSGWFTVTEVGGYQIEYHGTYGGHTYTKGAKIGSSTNISFTTTVRSDVTIVQCISRSNDGNAPLNFDDAALTDNQITAQEDGVYIEYTVTNVAAGTHHIKRGASQTGLFFIKVTENVFTMEFNENDIYYADILYVNPTFNYISTANMSDDDKAKIEKLRLKLNLNMPLESSDFSTSHFQVTTSNAEVISVEGYSVETVGSQANRIYISVKVKGTGTATLTFNYDGTGTYKNTATCSQVFNVQPSVVKIFDNTYPFTWDFQNNDWSSTMAQTKASSWWDVTTNATSGYAMLKNNNDIPTSNDIDIIKGLGFSGSTTSTPCLDWYNKRIEVASGKSITLPSNLSAGQIITINSSATFTAPEGTTQMGRNTFRVNDGTTSVTLYAPSNCYIYSITISTAGQANYSTSQIDVGTNGCKFLFTGTGNIDGGMTIKDVPGIEFTFGNSSDNWTVTQDSKHNSRIISYTTEELTLSGYIPQRGTYYILKPSVNGYLSIEGCIFGNHTYVLSDGEQEYSTIKLANQNYTTSETFDKPLIAGRTYYLYNKTGVDTYYWGKSWLTGFSYNPAFLDPTTLSTTPTRQSGTFEAYASTTDYPEIIETPTSGVTFSSGETSVATIELNGDGTPSYVSTNENAIYITANITSPTSGLTSYTSYPLKYNTANINPTIAFNVANPADIYYRDYGEDISGHSTFTNAIASSTPAEALTGATITYTSDDESIAKVGANGALEIWNSGTVHITATMAAHNQYLEATQFYTLTIKPDITSEIRFNEAGPVGIPFGNSHPNKAVVYADGVAHPEAYVTYSSSDASKVSVNSEGLVTANDIGSYTITAKTFAHKRYTSAEATYTVNVTRNTDLSLKFAPEASGYVNVGATISPYLGIGSVKADRLGTITVTSSDDTKATATIEIIKNDLDGTVHKLKPTFTGVAETGSTPVTITVTLANSEYYQGATATYKLWVKATGSRNFSWRDGTVPEYKVFEGDFMIMPMIDGNSNSNNNYSDNTKNKYLYQLSPKNSSPSSASDFNFTYNENDYRRYEGVPDFEIVSSTAADATTSNLAYIFNSKGEGGRTGSKPDTLMIYALPLGASANQTVYIRAYEPDDHSKYCDAKLTIMPKSTLTTAHSADVAAVHFPYTWDFTKDFGTSATSISGDNVYWTPVENNPNNYQAGGGFFNIKSYAKPNDKTYDPKNSNIYFQNFVANGNTLPQFKGLMVCINGTSSWGTKVERLQVTPTAGKGNSHLFFNGGYHELLLPDVSESNIVPDNYKLFIKVKGSGGGGKVNFIQGSTSIEKSFGTTETTILDYDATKTGGQILLRLNNTHVYWIATSTEAKVVNIHPTSFNAVATYSYGEDLDFDKSLEANNSLTSGSNLKAYYVSAYGSDNVTLTQVPAGGIAKNQGLVLKSDITTSGNYYMVADPENTESATAPTTMATNYLVGTSNKVGQTIPSSETIESETWSNFLLSKEYTKYEDNFTTVIQANIPTSDWAFYRLHSSTPTAPASMAYLHVKGDTYGHYGQARSALNNQKASGTSTPLNELLYLTFVDRDGNTETTVIGDVKRKMTDNPNLNGEWYTTQGIRVTMPTKGGIYIHNGKKVVVK